MIKDDPVLPCQARKLIFVFHTPDLKNARISKETTHKTKIICDDQKKNAVTARSQKETFRFTGVVTGTLYCLHKPEARGNASKVSAEFIKNFRWAKPGAGKAKLKKNACSTGLINNHNRLK